MRWFDYRRRLDFRSEVMLAMYRMCCALRLNLWLNGWLSGFG
jgi:hypothetical protein